MQARLDRAPLNKNILYIDDHPVNIRLLENFFQGFDELSQFNLITARTGMAGLNMAQDASIDLFLVDIRLPGLNGFDILKSLRSNKSYTNTPVFAVTASAMNFEREQGLQAGFDEYIVKPLNMRDLQQKISQYI